LPTSEIRVDDLERNLFRLLAVYDLQNDVFADKSDLHWPQLNMISKDVATDLYYVFSYFDKKKRKETSKDKTGKSNSQQKSPTQDDLRNFMNRYLSLGGEENMGIIGEIVTAYAQFYRADWSKQSSAYAVLKPFSEAADVVVESDPKTEKDDLVLLVAGAIGDLMERVRGNQADGFNPILVDTSIGYPERVTLSREKQLAFATLFVEKVFYDYCNGDRALLRERTSRLRAAARFYYLSNYGYIKKETNND
jgi:CRISPR-associated protein Csc3